MIKIVFYFCSAGLKSIYKHQGVPSTPIWAQKLMKGEKWMHF